MTLDRSRPYGEVYGDASHRYEQDGRHFDLHGNEVGSAQAPIEPPPAVELSEADQILAQATASVPPVAHKKKAK